LQISHCQPDGFFLLLVCGATRRDAGAEPDGRSCGHDELSETLLYHDDMGLGLWVVSGFLGVDLLILRLALVIC
jgi:hypothetical protein